MPASATSDVLPLFLELAAVPSPPGDERAVADRVIRYLRDLGLAAREDGAGERVGSNAGNILARLEPVGPGGDGGTPIFLCAHLDTVAPSGPIEPVVDGGKVRNAAGTILGADDKASVAAMLEAARVLLAERRPHAGVELLFTVREETGCEGAAAFDGDLLEAAKGFVYDYEGPIGQVVVAAPHQRTVDCVFKGRAAHAGISPEDGRSAIVAAARAVVDLRLGRIDTETTANVGIIEGGVARNVVPDRCRIVAEARSLDEARLEELVGEMLDSLAFAASVAECEVETQVGSKYPGYRLSPGDAVLGLARTALVRCGFAVETIESNGGSDANIFNGRGLTCANLANGMARIHSPEEEIAVADLEAMVGVTLELVEAARTAAC
jgi:tripeptide aminopeptidase